MSSLILDVDCPECGEPFRVPDPLGAETMGPCPACAHVRPLPKEPPPVDASDGSLRRCVACGFDELYRTKSFPRALGLGIIAAAGVLMFWLNNPLPIVGAAVLDAVLYVFLPDIAVCYRCHGHHHRARGVKRLGAYDLELASSLEKGLPWVKKRHLNHPAETEAR